MHSFPTPSQPLAAASSRRGRLHREVHGWLTAAHEHEHGHDHGHDQVSGDADVGSGGPFGPGGGPFGPGGGPFGPGSPFGRGGPRGPRGPFGPGGRRGGGRRGGRGGRGDVRAAVLLLLAEQPMHGYQLIQQMVERSGGMWTPSPGSVYPALQLLEDEGLVSFERVDGRKTASLTDHGRTHVEAHGDDLGSPWDDVSGGVSTEVRDLHELVAAMMAAVHQVMKMGNRQQAAAAATVLVDARKALYRILADADQT